MPFANHLLVRPVVIQTATETVDRYNNTTLDWTAPTQVSARAWIAQTNTFENQDHRDATVTSLTATFPPDTVIDTQDRVVIDGAVYEVNGKPHPAWTPRGVHHIEVQLVECAG